MGFEFLHCLWGVVDEGETGCLSTTELGTETEDVDLVLASLVEFGEFASELILGDVGTVWVEDVTILKKSNISLPIQKYPHPSLYSKGT